jgi:ABC-type polysaccharide/polyol phosphate export permease
MHTYQLVFLGLAGLIAIFFGFKYLLAREYMPYHATVVGRPWEQLEPGVQAVIIGMYRIMGGGFITYGAALLWLLRPMDDLERWAPLAALTITVTTLVPFLFVTLWLRHVQPAARTPFTPAALVFILAVTGAGLFLVPG